MKYLGNQRGSNQFKRQYHWFGCTRNADMYLIRYIMFVLFAITIGGMNKLITDHREALDHRMLVTQAHASELALKPVMEHPTTEQQAVIADIQQVFGGEADKAFQLLSCENHSLNPNAVNVNDDQWASRDIGVFQVNNHWQGVSNEAFLRDFHINIRIAYNIYSRDGHTFKLWTCGRKLGL